MPGDSYLERGITAAKAGDRGSARRFLCLALQEDPGNEAAYLWLSAVLGSPQARAFCLEAVLAINPNNMAARRGLEALPRRATAALPGDQRGVPGAMTAAEAGIPAGAAAAGVPAGVQTAASSTGLVPRRRGSALARVLRYSVARAAGLFLSVVVAVLLTIVIANLGGYVDEVVKANIDIAVGMLGMTDEFRFMDQQERDETLAQIREGMYRGSGLNEPFMLRTFRWLRQGLTLDWGQSRVARVMSYGRSVRDVSAVILDRLPRTLLLFGTANLFLFFSSIGLALFMTRKYGSVLDRLVITLTPLSSVPAWVYGVVLNVLLMRVLGSMIGGGTFDSWPREFTLAHLPYILRYMFLPFLSILLSGIFQSIYAWRAFFLLYASEDHVEMAKATGLPPRIIERRHILRLGLPNVVTSFALLLITLWQEVVALEWIFNVEGIGQLFVKALGVYDTATILGLVVVFAYLFAISVFVLDVVYVLVDPRVRIGTDGQTLKPAVERERRWFWQRRRRARRRTWRARREAPAAAAWQPRAAPGFSLRKSLLALADGVKGFGRRIAGLRSLLPELVHYPSLAIGGVIISFLVGVSIYTVIALPYQASIYRWRGDEMAWQRYPLRAMPAWTNLFRKNDLPETIIFDSREQATWPDGRPLKTRQAITEEMTEIAFSFPFDYPYEGFPQDISLRVDAVYERKKPLLTLTWLKPAAGSTGERQEVDIGSFTIAPKFVYSAYQDERLRLKLGEQNPVQGLFMDSTALASSAKDAALPAEGESPVAVPGEYELQVSGFVFEEGADLEAELVVYGQVYGLAGTDHNRRDLMLALLWGTPVALSFGLLAAFGTSVVTMVIAGVGVWFGGRVDSVIQRITEVNMILPFLPVSIMIYTLYSKSFWMILGVTVALSIFGAAIKNYRAIFLQIKEAPYVEAAQAYGASDWRIISRYLVPRIGTVLIPQLVILVPAYVFLEATLALLGVSDPMLPTWGKLVVEALDHSLHSGDYHLVLIPVGALMVTGFGFALVGMALERILDPRLRER